MAGAYSDKLTHKDHSPAVVPGGDPIPDKPEPTQQERREKLDEVLDNFEKYIKSIRRGT